MMNTLKIIGVTALAAAGLASAAVAQQTTTNTPAAPSRQHQQMMSGGMQDGHMMTAMSDPQMRKQMMEMMESCNRMMQHMGNMPGQAARPKT